MLSRQNHAIDISAIVESTIVHEDAFIVIVNKPASVHAQPVEDKSPNMLEALQQTRPMLYPIRRLDRNCSGVMVFAKTEKAAAFLSRSLNNEGFQEALEDDREHGTGSRGVVMLGNLTEKAR